MDEINNIVLQKEFVFVDARYDFKLLDDNKIDVVFTFKDLEKTFIEQINIFGNFITDEKVIRNSLIVDEGDAFNQTLFDKYYAIFYIIILIIKLYFIFKNIAL